MRLTSIALLLASVACSPGQTPVRSLEDRSSAAKKPGGGSGLVDHGGPVLASSTTYAIYWGDPSAFDTDLASGMDALLGGMNGSSYLGIAQQYLRGASIASAYMGSFTDTSSPPRHAPKASDLGAEVCKLFAHPDANGIYVVFTSNTPNISYCAWHDKASCNGVTFQVAYIPNQAGLPGCSPYTRSNLGCNALSNGAVTAADSVAHEFMEAVTDPHIDAWYDNGGQEIADKCNYNYQSCVTLGNGSKWQIQSEWSNLINGCQQQ